MLDNIRVAACVLVACGAGFGVYYGYTAHVQTQLDADLADTRTQLANSLTQIKETERRLNATAFDSRTASEQVVRLTSQLTAAADHLRTQTTAIAGSGCEAVQLKRERDLYKSTLSAAISAPASAFGVRPDSVVRELQKQFAAMSRLNSADISQSVGSVRLAERALMRSPSERGNADYEWQLSLLKARAMEAWRMGDDLQSFVDQNKSSLADSGSVVKESLLREIVPKAALRLLLADIDQCIGSHRTMRCTVRANEDWQSSNVAIAYGEVMAIAASGQWMERDGRQHVFVVSSKGRGTLGKDPGRLVEVFPRGAILLRTEGTDFVYEGCESVQLEYPGRVEFRLNDWDVAGNHGAFEVVIWVFRPLRSE